MKKDRPPKPAVRPLPSKPEIIAFLRDNPTKASKREIARFFNVTGDARVELKVLIRELEAEGFLDRSRGYTAPKSAVVAAARAVPEILVVDVSHIDAEGEVNARPAVWTDASPPPEIRLVAGGGDRPSTATPGERVLVRVLSRGVGLVRAEMIRTLPTTVERVVGIYEKVEAIRPGARGPVGGGWIRSSDRRNKDEYRVAAADSAEAETGDIVLAELMPGIRFGSRQAKVIERLGAVSEPKSISLIAIHEHQIPTEFSEAALAQAEAALPPTLGDRTDLRKIPLVTIDGADARDFDDAVFAEADEDPANPGGWHLIVAIADVAHYVKPGSPLDRDAYTRGNSVYFPDRVVPMLPEALSNGLCSLKPDEDRACMAVHIWIDAQGNKVSHRFVRGLMRSVARLTYERLQAARDGADPDAVPDIVTRRCLVPLYGAFASLNKAREKRGTLDLDLPERQIKLDPAGRVTDVEPRQRLDSHRLIEEFMILANVCAAESLEAARTPCMYRVHDVPSDEKLEGLRLFLDGLSLRLAKGQVIKPITFMQLLKKVEGTANAPLVNEVVLRAQAQAMYSPDNIGHFGLALRRYAHFTSPIRRYADLLVHRGLIRALNLGDDGLGAAETAGDAFPAIGAHISATERRAALAERDAVERFTAAFMATRIGDIFQGRISGVMRFGLFVRIDQLGADGLLPIKSLPRDYYVHDEDNRRLVGERNGMIFTMGDPITVQLLESDLVTGSVGFAYVDGAGEPLAPPPPKRLARGRGGPPRHTGPLRRGKPRP